MSKDIWHKPIETTDVDNNLIIDDWTNGTYELGYFDDNDMIFRNFRNDDIYDEESMMRWCDVDDIVNDYERLQNELERTRKALEMTDTDLAIIVTNLDKVFPDMRLVFETIRSARKRIAEITALEQEQ